MIHIGKTARELRETLGLTQIEVADRLGLTNVYISKIENDHSFPSREIIEKYRMAFGVDLYVFAWCEHGDVEKLPASLREPAKALAAAWKKRFAILAFQRRNVVIDSKEKPA